MVEKQCEKCGAPFLPRYNRPSQRFCSLQCYGRARVVTPPTFACECCGKVTVRRRFRMADGRELGYDYTARFCSKTCGYKGRNWRPINPDGHVCHGTGYIRVNLRGGGHILKHREVMEKTIGRKLLPGENVHHLDGDRANNAPDNLELWTSKQPPGQRVIDKVRYAIEMLRLYPEIAAAEGFPLTDHQLSAAPESAHPSAPP